VELSTQTVRGLPLPGDLRMAEVAGTSLAYRERGTGEPVVFVHGSISDLSIWEPQLEPIGARHRAIAYSRRYAWPNEDLPAGQKDVMQPHVDDLLAFLRAVDAHPAHLVGNSWGAFICLRAAMQEPAAVRSLVLEEPPVVPLLIGAPPSPRVIARSLARHPRATRDVLRFAARTLAPAGKLVKRGQLEASIERFARGVLGAQAFAGLPQQLRRHMLANAATHAGQFLADGGFEPLAEAQVSAVTAPALVITGAGSPPMFHSLAALLASLLPHSRTLDIPSASHAMHYENPEATNAAIIDFLDDHAGSVAASRAAP
jgi:pimeloyl-ACP methyl ester carboxylesterase